MGFGFGVKIAKFSTLTKKKQQTNVQTHKLVDQREDTLECRIPPKKKKEKFWGKSVTTLLKESSRKAHL